MIKSKSDEVFRNSLWVALELGKALQKQNDLQSDLDKYKEAEKFVDDPPHDQECCGCVAILRKQKADLQAELDKTIMKNTKSLLEIGGLQVGNKQLKAEIKFLQETYIKDPPHKGGAS